MTDPENDLRRMLAQQAGDAPDGSPIAERVLAQVATQRGVKRGWQRWAIPAAAAAVVAAVTAGAFGLSALHSDHASDDRSVAQSPRPSSTHGVPVSPKQTVSGDTTAGNKGSAETTDGTEFQPLPAGFVATDLSFDTEASGWVIGSTGCGTAECAYLGHSDTVGGGWSQVSQLPAPVAAGAAATCSHAPCVNHVRFYDSTHGYLYGPEAFYTTSNGGRTWTAKAGQGATALEVDTLSAVRVTSSAGCTTQCSFGVEHAKPGAATWTAETLSADPVIGSTAILARAHDTIYLAVADKTGADQVFVSKDQGVKWSAGPVDPCVSESSGAHVTDLATDVGGTQLVVLCVDAKGQSTVRTGALGSTSLSTAGPTVDTGTVAAPQVAAPSKDVVIVAGQVLYRGTSHASSEWTAVPDVKGSTGVCFLGFENATVGRFVSDDGTTVWTTQDAGKSWTPTTFS
ncbi:MAG: hypothetical protein ACR2KJ_03280 [Jatrophihabitans sp.]